MKWVCLPQCKLLLPFGRVQVPSDQTSSHPRAALLNSFLAGVEAADPYHATLKALAQAPPPPAAPAVLSLGKAAIPMAAAMSEWLGRHGIGATGGLVVTAETDVEFESSLPIIRGDHPVPGPLSEAASRAIARAIEDLAPGQPVEVLISGGASSLIAAPLTGGHQTITAIFEALPPAGLPIQEMNTVRRRATRWGGGRLGIALGDRPLRCWLISDVPGDDLTAVASGPLIGLSDSDLNFDIDILDTPLRTALERAGHQTPPPLREVPHTMVLNGLVAQLAAAKALTESGWEVVMVDNPVIGDAEAAGTWLVDELFTRAADKRLAMVARGETTVTLGTHTGQGGRAQHLALSAARAIHRSEAQFGRPSGVHLLAAGTDGRDGPTDAAGAMVDGTTWNRILEMKIDPEAALRDRDSYSAFNRIGDLIRIGPTGTNVADLMIGLVVPPAS